MANIITSCRILCSILLLFVPAFSPMFYILYLVAGFTDMIDGTIARKTGTANEFGSRLDTLADIAFVVVCMIKLFPVLIIEIQRGVRLYHCYFGCRTGRAFDKNRKS